MDDRTEFCRQLAQDAGRLAHTAFGTSPTSMTGRRDVLTAMDGQVERFIRRADCAALPRRRRARRGRGRLRGLGQDRPALDHRSDRRHGEFRARNRALLCLHRPAPPRRAAHWRAARPGHAGPAAAHQLRLRGAGEDTLHGTCVRVAYLGSRQELVVDTPGGELLVFDPVVKPRRQAGEAVPLAFDPESAIVLPR